MTLRTLSLGGCYFAFLRLALVCDSNCITWKGSV